MSKFWPGFVGRFKTLGPGLITGAADDDPSGISTYSVAGASTGLSMTWLALATTPMMAVIQGMCARIGFVTGRGLAANIRAVVPAWAAYPIAAAVVVANTFNVGADFAGMGASAHMLLPGIHASVWVVFFGALLVLTLVFLSYRVICDTIKWLTVTLFAYVFTAFVIRPHWGDVLKSLVIPHIEFSRTWLTTMLGVMGTTITPYLFFWQASLEVEEEKSLGLTSVHKRRGATPSQIADIHFDVNTGMIFSNLIMFFIIVTTALTLYAHGMRNIATAQQAAEALVPLAGRFAGLLFTLGIVGTGLLAIPALAGSSAYVAAEILSFREGLNERPRRAPRFYGVLSAGLVIGVVMAFVHIDPIRALYYAAVLNGFVSIPLIFLIIRIASSHKIMGRWRSSMLAKIWGWLTFFVMAAAAISIFAV